MSLLDDVSIVVTPNGYKAGELYAVVPVPTEGTELVTNGDFATDSDWTLSQTTIANDKATVNSTSAYGIKLTQATTIGLNKTYKLLFTVADVGANINFKIGFGNLNNGVYSDLITTAGTYEIYLTQTDALAPSQILILTWSIAVQTFSITNISVKESTRNDLARVDYTGSTSSLLAEPQRTNLITYSEDFSQWIANGVSLDYNQGTSPDGLSNATRLHTLTDGNLYVASANTSFENTISFYVKSNNQSKDNFQLRLGGTTTNYTATSDWVKYTYSTTPNSTIAAIRNVPSEDLDVLIWGAQLEEGSYATSYIPTSGSTVTRVQDQYSKTGISDKINSEEGVLFLESSSLSNDGTSRCISIFQNGSNFIKFIYSSSSNRVDFVAFSNGNVSCNITKFISNTTENTKFGLKWKVNDFALWIDGVEVGTDLSGNTPLGMDKISFTNEGGSSGNYFGKVKQLQVFKTALTDSELATLTTI